MKNPALKKKRNWRNILTYLATYIVVTFSVAFVVVSFSNKTYSASSSLMQIEETPPSALGMMVTNLMEVEDARLNLNSNIKSGSDDIGITGSVNLKIYPEFTGLDIDLDMIVDYNGTPNYVRLTYVDDVAYISVNDMNVSVKSSTILTAVAGALNMCGISIDLSADLISSFDMSMLDDMGDMLSEEKQGENTLILVKLADDITIKVLTDKDYNIIDVVIDKINLNGTELDATVDFEETNMGAKITKPDRDFVDVSESMGIVEAFINTFSTRQLAFSFDAFKSNFDVQLDFKNKMMQFKTTANENDFTVSYVNNNLYLDANIVKLKTSLPKFDPTVLGSLAGMQLDNSTIEAIKNTGNEALELIKRIELQKIEKTDFGYQIVINGKKLQFVTRDGVLTEFRYVGETQFSVVISNSTDITVNDEEYTPINDFEFLLDPIEKIVRGKKAYFDIDLEYGDFKVSGLLFIEFGEQKFVQFSTTLMDVDILLTVDLEGVKIKVGDVKIATDFSSISNVVDELTKDKEKSEITISDILKHTVQFVKSNENQIEIKYDNIRLDVVANDVLEKVKIDIDDLKLSISANDTISADKNFSGYELVIISKDNVRKLIEKFESKTFGISGTVGYGDYEIGIDAKIDLSEGLSNAVAVAKINAFNHELNIAVQQGKAFVQFETVKMVGNLKELATIMGALESGFSVPDISFTINSISKIDSVVRFNLDVCGNNIVIELDIDNMLLSVNCGELNLNMAINLGMTVDKLSETQMNEYHADMSQLVNFVKSVVNSTKQENIKAIVLIEAGDTTYRLDLYIVGKESKKVKFETTIENIHLSGYYCDNKIYVNMFDICFMVDLSDSNQIEQFVEVLNLDKTTTGDLMTLIGGLSLNKLTKFETTENLLKLRYDNIDVNLHTYDNAISRVQLRTGGLDANISIAYPKYLDFELDNNRVIKLKDLAYVGRAFYNTFKNKTISGDLDLTFNMFNEENTLNVRYGIKLGEDLTDIAGYIETEFKGLEVKAYFIDDTFYLDAIGLKIKLAMSDLPNLLGWVKENFVKDLDTGDLFKDFKLEDLSLDFITSAVFEDGLLKAVLNNNIYIDAEYTDVFNRITFAIGSTKAVVRCTGFDIFTITNFDGSEYKDYSLVTDMIDALMNTANEKQFNIVASSKVYRNNSEFLDINIGLMIDFANGFKFSGNATVSGNTNVVLKIDYIDNMLYVDYYGLKLKIGKKSIAEILAIVTQLLNIDTSKIPALEELQKDLKLDMDNLGAIVPTMQSVNPLNYLNYLKNIDIDSDSISISLNGEKLNGNAHFDPVVKLISSNGRISGAEITELYTGVTEDERMTMDVRLIEFSDIPVVVDNGAYVDLTNSIDLIKALINTSSLTDYHIAGDVVLSLKLGSLKIDAAVLNIDVKVKLDSVTKAPTIAIKISNYPLIGLVNNKNTNGVGDTGLALISQRHRTINIYYKSNELFLQTIDEYWKFTFFEYEELNRVTKVTPDYMFKNLSYYVQWLLGFTDTIQAEIDNAIATSNANKAEAEKAGTIDYSDIIKNYVVEKGVHSCDINIGKLCYNVDIGTLHIDIATRQETNNNESKYYIGLLNFKLDLLNELIIINAEKGTDYNLELKDIGSTVNVDETDVAFENKRFLLDGEYQKEGNGAWTQASQGETTVTLVNGNKVFAELAGGIGTQIVLPTPAYPDGMTSLVKFDNATLIETTYRFDGWYDATGKLFSSSSYPRYSTTLYAKWSTTTRKQYTIAFVTNENVSKDVIRRFAGDVVNLGTLPNITFTEGYTTYLKSFDGWYYDELCTNKCVISVMPEGDVILYAGWKISELSTINIYSLIIFNSAYSEEQALYENDKVIEGEFDLTAVYGSFINSETLFYTTADFASGSEVTVTNGKINIASDMVLYTRSKFNYTIYSAYTIADGNEYLANDNQYMGEEIGLTVFDNYQISYSSYNRKYKFLGYWAKDINSDNTTDGYVASELITTTNGEIVISMPLKDTKFVAVWDVKDYVIVTFNPLGWVNPSWWTIEKNATYKSHTDVISSSTDYVVSENTLEIVKGTRLDTTLFKATTQYSYRFIGTMTYDFETVAWAESVVNLYDDSYKGETTFAILSHITLQPVWKHV